MYLIDGNPIGKSSKVLHEAGIQGSTGNCVDYLLLDWSRNVLFMKGVYSKLVKYKNTA